MLQELPSPNALIWSQAMLPQQKSETEIAVDGESALATIAEEAREVLDVRGIPSVVRHPRRIALEATIANVENLSEIGMHPDRQLGIWLLGEMLAAVEKVVERVDENETVREREMGADVMAVSETLHVSFMKLDGMVSVAPSEVQSEDQKEVVDAAGRWEAICGVKSDEIVAAQERMEEERDIVRKGRIPGEGRKDQDDRWGASRWVGWIHLADLYDGLRWHLIFVACLHWVAFLTCEQRNIFEAFQGEMGDWLQCEIYWETGKANLISTTVSLGGCHERIASVKN
jgi:hypothetical protein